MRRYDEGTPRLVRGGTRAVRPVATYSILAADEGAFGAAAQSHWFGVGSLVPWLRPGVGGGVTQSFFDTTHSVRGLPLLGEGGWAADVLAALLHGDDEQEFRQLAVVDRNGSVATHTGARCIAEAGHRVGPGFSTQANMMGRPGVWDAMARAFEQASGDLPARLLSALQAAEAEGGDLRGQQSATLVVVPRDPAQPVPVFDLRVEDHPHPLEELSRLVTLRRAYVRLDEGDAHMARGDLDSALASYRGATEIVPDEATHGEAAFWTGITLVATGREDAALEYLRRAVAQRPGWADFLPRLPPAGILPDDQHLVERLGKGMAGPPE